MKKLLSIMLIMLGIGMVLAVGVYYYPYYTRIQVHGIINHPVQEISIPKSLAIRGNLIQILNCDIGQDCKSNWINISNPTIYNQTIKIEITIPNSVSKINLMSDGLYRVIGVPYNIYNISITCNDLNNSCCNEINCYNNSWSSLFVITPDEEYKKPLDNDWNSFAFTVIYHLKNDTNDTEFYSNITITSNMTQS